MITIEYLLLQTDRYIQLILQSYSGFQRFTHALEILTFHISKQITYLENPVFEINKY